ncbi:MFS transporter [Pseudonocardiaceae bacterium YIM PH 21723]|nr:MFS transporter [Pseudonocardiaceae bacterium YIM PH 21723]
MDDLLSRIGIPKKISWGFAGVFLFMVGVGLELSWLSPYLVAQGVEVAVVAAVFSTYGISVSLASWLSGVFFEIVGAKRTMLVAFALFTAGTALFVAVGVQQHAVWALFAGYAIKGFSYPLFSYSFLVWIAYRAERDRMSAAYGWFWFAFSGGISVVGAYGSDLLLTVIGEVPVLWCTIAWAALGTVAIVVLNRDDVPPVKGDGAKRWRDLATLFTIVRTEPRLLLVLGIRIVNTLPQFALPVFVPIYLQQYGFSTSEWLSIWGTMWLSNIVFNLIAGHLGDRMGWKRTISYFGGFGCAVSVIAFFYAPQVFGHDYWALLVVGLLFGMCIAGYVPLDAIVANLVRSNKGAALSILNLGAGLSTLAGPLIVALFAQVIGYAGVAWILSLLYVAAGFAVWHVTPRQAQVAPLSG